MTEPGPRSDGLTRRQAADALDRFGPNELPPPDREGVAARIGRQLREPMSLLLIAAAATAGIGLGERLDAAVILAIVALNAGIGVLQEGSAARALEALRRMETPTARVRRDGRDVIVPAREVVPGDLVLLAAGDRVPADLRLVDSSRLQTDESILTGESLPVEKRATPRRDAEPAGDDPSTVFSGTLVTRGAGVGSVDATGSETMLGRIASGLRDRPPPTPLQRELTGLSKRLGAVAVAIAVAVFALILVRKGLDRQALEESFLSAVALAVAAVPEGLATVVAVALALGVRRMAAEDAIVRRLAAVETLGSATVIATDKTGTLTENRMRLEHVLVPGEPEPFAPAELRGPVAERSALVAALCSDATADPPSGDPVEIALLTLARGRESALRQEHPRVAGVPFEAELKRMLTVHRAGDRLLVLLKGAPEVVLDLCTTGRRATGDLLPLDDDDRRDLLSATDGLAAHGVRVLALAIRDVETSSVPPGDTRELERDLELVCLAALRDPVRREAPDAVAEAASAGIRILMVTGDHPGTARAIAAEVGLASSDATVLTGSDLRAAIPEDPTSVAVYARVAPEQKLELVEALRHRGHVVAVTGDGVNDAPALRHADIGVAMGRSGSDVAREAADMVVVDDNLATIVTAVREGRAIYDNIRKVVEYLIAGNFSEISVVVVALLAFPELGVPLLPLQLLWINLLTDGLPSLALGVDPIAPGLMSRPPRRREDRLLRARRVRLLVERGLLIAAAALASLVIARFAWDEPWPAARALMFTVLVITHLLYAFVARHPTRGPLTNPLLFGAVASGIVAQVLIVVWTPAHEVFDTVQLSLRGWIVAVAMAVSAIVAMRLVQRAEEP